MFNPGDNVVRREKDRYTAFWEYFCIRYNTRSDAVFIVERCGIQSTLWLKGIDMSANADRFELACPLKLEDYI